MDEQKVVHVLRQIFDQRGIEIVGQQGQFRAAVYDLLDSLNYKDERLIIRNAIESNALTYLTMAKPVTNEVAQKAVEQMRKSGHMTEEDAEFVVKCFITASGGDPGVMVPGGKPQIRAEGGNQQEEMRKQQQLEGGSQGEGSDQEKERKLAVLATAICAGIAVVAAAVWFCIFL